MVGGEASPPSSTELITKGDFTKLTNGLGQIIGGSYTSAVGWVTTGYNFVFNSESSIPGSEASVGLWGPAYGVNDGFSGAPNGGNFLALDGAYKTAAVSQTVFGLTVGKTYTLNYNYAFAQQQDYYGAATQNLTVGVGTAASVKTPDFSLPSQGFSGWNAGQLSFTAASTSEVVSFLAYGNLPVPPFALVSNVSLQAVSVPGPEVGVGLLSFAMLGALAFARRRLGRRTV